MKYVGIDVHKKMCQAAILDEDGTLLDERRFPNTMDGIKEFAAQLTTYKDQVKASSSRPVTSGSRYMIDSRNADST